MKAYFDSSVVLRWVLGESSRLRDLDKFTGRVGNELVEVECLRALDRMRLAADLDEEEMVDRREALYRWLETLDTVQLTRPLLRRAAEPFPVALRTLDAIHLATALAWGEEYGEDLVMATHDTGLAKAARAFGLKAVGV